MWRSLWCVSKELENQIGFPNDAQISSGDYKPEPEYTSGEGEFSITCKKNLSSLPHQYFEITIVQDRRRCSCVAEEVIGLCHEKGLPSNRLPGQAPASYGYNFYYQSPQDQIDFKLGEKYGKVSQVGDIAGCGVDPDGNLFFTRNKKIYPVTPWGRDLNPGFLNPKELYPALGFTSKGTLHLP